jgi:hypothetical protein
MTSTDVQTFVTALGRGGLSFMPDGRAVDLVVVDQVQGPTCPCDWIAFGAGLYMSSAEFEFATPAGWEYDCLLSKTFIRIPDNEMAGRVLPLGPKGGIEVVLDLVTGREGFVGRTQLPVQPDSQGREGAESISLLHEEPH